MNAQSSQSEGYTYVAKVGSVWIRSGQQPVDSSTWADDVWQRAEKAQVASFSASSSSHRPASVARLLHDQSFFYLRFDVCDRFVLAQALANQDDVFRDSCVECFLRPPGSKGYFNFEFNCGGTILASFIEDPVRMANGLRKCTPIDSGFLDQILIARTLPKNIDPEIPGPIDWKLCSRIPFALLEHYAGDLGRRAGTDWSCNFYKCAEANSHPHWASWAPIGDELNFHQPDRFGRLILEDV